jgi:hypothetical protein
MRLYFDYQFTYNWKHIPSGKQGTRTKHFVSYEAFLDAINDWNRVGGGDWLYWR